MVEKRTEGEIWHILGSVSDPEIPVLSVVDMKIVRSVTVNGAHAEIVMTPTFSGCPALDLIRNEIATAVRELGFETVDVRVDRTASWSTDLMDESARQKLRSFGVAPPNRTAEKNLAPPQCPFCSSDKTRMEASFGPTLCKQIFYCDACQQSFDRFKTL